MRASLQRSIATTVLCVQALIATASGDSVTHVVRAGDTLSGIARKYYGDARRWDRIVAANSLSNPNRLREGQKLVIPVGDGSRLPKPDSFAGAARTSQPLASPPATPDSETIRRLAAAAVVQHYTNLDLSAYDPGYLIRLESPTPEAGARVVVSWLGRETLALEKGATPELDRKQVLKIEAWLTEDGQVLKITDRPVWLNRNVQGAAVQ